MKEIKLGKLPDFGSLLRAHFFAGLLVVIPLGVIVWITVAVVRFLWRFQILLPPEWRPDNFIADPNLALVVNGVFTVGFALLIAFTLSVLGWISKQFLGRKILQILSEIILYIPVLRSVYSALDQLLRAVASGEGQQFSRVVYVEYPRKGSWAIAFVTGKATGPAAPAGHLNIYVPTTPNPTSGFHLIVPEAEVRESGMKVEEAFKTILSLGIAQPPNSPQLGGTSRGG
jgi:uncharacterized membrane protein